MKTKLLHTILGLGALVLLLQGCCGETTPQAIRVPVPERVAGQSHVLGLAVDPIDTVRVAFVGLGMRGSGAVYRYCFIPGVEVVGLCDVEQSAVDRANATLAKQGKDQAASYVGPDAWRELIAQEGIDLIYICTDWASHTPIATEAMRAGKHVAIEVPATVNVAECWQLVDVAEQTRRHCIMLENCVYDRFEITTLNMAQQGLFGEVMHVEGAYIHDLRSMLFAEQGEPGHYWDMWRLRENTSRTGDVYPTHGLGPVAQILGLHRGDMMTTLVSMNTDQVGLTAYATKKFGADSEYAKTDYRMGDHTTTLIRTQRGKTMMIQHDVTSPRPYSRIHQVSGTKGFAQKYPMAGILLEPDNEAVAGDYEDLSGHRYVSRETMGKLMEEYTHPVIRQVGQMAQQVGGHGGMDFVMDFRLVYCLRNGLPLDMDVYDAAEWSCLTSLSELSITNGSAPVAVPDFTRGDWVNGVNKKQTFAFTPEDALRLGVK